MFRSFLQPEVCKIEKRTKFYLSENILSHFLKTLKYSKISLDEIRFVLKLKIK